MKKAQLIFPHQLFLPKYLDKDVKVFIIEEHLFFNQYKFHKHKLAFHIASMTAYRDELKSLGFDVVYIKCSDKETDFTLLIESLKVNGFEGLFMYPLTDDWLESKLLNSEIKITYKENPQFLLQESELSEFFQNDRKRYLHSQFYQKMRKRGNYLLEKGKPTGGKWSYDDENRKAYKKGEQIPFISFPQLNKYWGQAIERVEKEFPDNYGKLNTLVNYPITRQEAKEWLNQFFEIRFHLFGKYEDAILKSGVFNHHSVLSMLINNGLLEPKLVVEQAIGFARENNVPLNSLEGFVRQIIGWREFIRGLYQVHGRKQRTTNHLKLKNKVPASFYNGTTGIEPVDDTIKKVLNSAYCHHIERLMVVGNFMLLCEINPDEVYQWFMELFVDAYDWVMVPNVYGMSQFADGGLFATKPYVSSSNYIIKMSDYKKGEWSDVWDALYWRFVDKHAYLFEKNPRSKFMLNNWFKKSPEIREELILKADNWLSQNVT